MRVYSDVCDELIKKGISPTDGGQFCDYTGFELEAYYDDFFKFGQTFLDREDIRLPIHPARIYYTTDRSINACARKQNGYYLIEINQGVITYLFREFYFNNNRFNESSLIVFRDIALKMKQEPAFLLFQEICLLFFYHEVGHLVQQSGQGDERFKEYLRHKCIGAEITVRHIRELDADWFAANHYASHIKDFADRLAQTDNLTESDTFENSAALLLSSVYIYFIAISGGDEMYFDRECHPHPAIRLTSIVVTVLQTLENLTDRFINKIEICKRAKQIAEKFMAEKNRHITDFYNQLISQNAHLIKEYINKIRVDTKDYPYASWRILSKNTNK